MIKKSLNLILGLSIILLLATIGPMLTQEPQVQQTPLTKKELQSTNEFESFVKDFVAHVANKNVAYAACQVNTKTNKDINLYFYADVKTSKILVDTFLTALFLGGASMPLFMDKSNKDYTGTVVISTVSGILGCVFSFLLIQDLVYKIKKTPYLTLSSVGISCFSKTAIKWADLDENMPIMTLIIKDQYGNQTGTLRSLTLRSKSSIDFDIVDETGDNALLPVKLEELREMVLRYKNHLTQNMQTN